MVRIECPHCEYEFTDDDMGNSGIDLWAICPNEENVGEICPKCKNTVWIKGSYIPDYETYKTEADLDA